MVIVVLPFGVWGSSALSAKSAGDTWVSFVWIDWVFLRVILPQITLITQRECSKLHYFADKDSLLFVWLLQFCSLGFGVRLRHLRDLRETLGFRLCNIAWVLLRVILSQITQITQRGMPQAALFRRERQLVAKFVLWLLELWVLWFVCVICEICGRHWGFLCANRLSTLMWIFSRR